MPLSLPKSFDPGTGQGVGRPSNGVGLKENQGQHLTCPPNVEEEDKHNKSIQAVKEQVILQLAETIWVNLNFTFPNYKFSNPNIMHLFPAKSVETISGTKAKGSLFGQHKEITRCLQAKTNQNVIISNILIPYDPGAQTPSTRGPGQNLGVVLSFLLKGEPPDVPLKIKPIKYRGKTLDSQKRMKPDLLYVGAGYPVSRSKPFQGGGDVAVTESAPEPEANQLHQPAIKRTNPDMHSVKKAYLSNREEYCHETNFHANYTQQGVRQNWNQTKANPDQGDMNFINRRFYNPTTCEHPSLDMDSSLMKMRSDPNQVMEFKMDLLAFQQAKNQEIGPRNYGVMAQSPKPAKPSPHLPYMGDPVLASNQGHKLESGDLVQHPEALYIIPGRTRTHWIRRILEELAQPNQSRFWTDFTIYRFNLLQPNHIRPEGNFIQPRYSEDPFTHSGRAAFILSWTSKHMIRRIYSCFNLPYMEFLAFKLQQLLFHQIVHELSTLKSTKKVPRKLSYPLKPSRFKRIKFLTWSPKSHQKLQRLHF